MILGLDVSTTAIGIALIDSEENILISDVLKLKSNLSLEDRAANFKDRIKSIIIDFPDIRNVFVESPIVLFKGGSSALTVSMLQRFNGMICFVLYELFYKKPPTLINVISARSVLGIKIARGKKNKKDKKQPIIDFVEAKYKNTITPFLYETTRYGNFKPGVDDRSDAIIVALAGKRSLT